jgi:hypothetical protein
VKPKLHAQIRAELALLVSQRLLTFEQSQRLAERYPTGRWDLVSLVRWFTILGAVAMGAGVLMLAPKVMDWRNLLDGGLVVAAGVGMAGGRWLGRSRGLVRTGAALELLGAMCLQGATVSLATHYSTGSDDWPSLVGVGTVLMLVAAYALQNRLVLIDACINAFVWFGGSTGYVSGWGAYWLGMNYPVRFLLAGAVTLGVAWAHARWAPDGWRHFSRVWAHFGLLVTHLAMWFLAVFGYFEKTVHWDGTEGQRLAFSAAWAGFCVVSFVVSSRVGLTLIGTYGLVFLVIDAYTFYFQFVVAHSAEWWFVHLLVVGGTMVGLGLWAERRRRVVGP